MKKILITGGAGFIGSNLTKRLLSSNLYHITCIDNFDSFYPRSIKNANIAPFLSRSEYVLIEGDIRGNEALNKVGDIDIVIHLAAKAGVRGSIQNPVLYQDVNVSGTQNILEFARLRKVSQFIFASSSSVYGTNPNFPWNENEVLFPISPYASSKLSGERLGQVYTHLYGLRFLALRLFTVYGPAQRPDLAISKFFNNITEGLPITLYGTGNSFRDYTHVDDIIKGIENALDYQESNYEIINLGCKNPITLNQLIATIENISSKTAIIDRHPIQLGDVTGTFADISKAQNLLGYCPAINLEDGLRLFYDWFCSNKKPNVLSVTEMEPPIKNC